MLQRTKSGTVSPASISLCVIARNEEEMLPNCLESVAPLVDEIVLVDHFSSDNTVEIAKSYGARVFTLEEDWTFARARTRAINEARSEWVLSLDADEAIASRDLAIIRAAAQQGSFAGYFIELRSYVRGADLLCSWTACRGEYAREEKFSRCPAYTPWKQLRFFRRLPGVEYWRSPSGHVNVLPSMKAHGYSLGDLPAVVHHFEALRLTDAQIQAKESARLELELAHLELFPRDVFIRVNVAKTMFALGRDEEAREFLHLALECEPENITARELLVAVLLETGELAQARESLDRLNYLMQCEASEAEGNRRNINALILNALWELEVGHFERAKVFLQLAESVEPLHPLVNINLGRVSHWQGDFALAAAYYRRVLEILPENEDAQFNLAALEQCPGVIL